jgi:hypothetical protein
VQQVFDIVKEYEPINPQSGILLFNQAHLEICSKVKLYPDASFTQTFTSGTGEYALADNVISMWTGTYYAGANSYNPLKQTNVDSLVADYGPDWRAYPASTPYAFYEDGGQIGFFPVPNVTSTGGYPCAVFSYAQAHTLALSDTLPTQINTPYPWVYYICRIQCVKNGHAEKMPQYDAMYKAAQEELATYIYRRTPKDRPRALFNIPFTRGA